MFSIPVPAGKFWQAKDSSGHLHEHFPLQCPCYLHLKQQPDYQLIVFYRGKIPWLGGCTLPPPPPPPRNEQVPVPECPLKPCARSCDTVQGLHDLAGMLFFCVDCFICSKGGGGDFISTSYLLSCPDNPLQNAGLPAPQLYILYFLVTVHFTAFNSTFQPSSTLSVLGWFIYNSFSYSLQAKLIKRITIKISNNITKQLSHSSCLYW